MNEVGACRGTVATDAPPDWTDLLAGLSSVEYTVSQNWTALAARSYPAARAVWLTADLHGQLAGGLPLLQRRRHGLDRLESSFDGTLGGPQLHADLSSRERELVLSTILGDLNRALRGRTILAALTCGSDTDLTAALHGRGWRRDDYDSALVDCSHGLDHVETELWTNNRRNERNRGLKRGAVLSSVSDEGELERWYPLYEAKSRQWAQAPVPLAFMRDLMAADPERVCVDTIQFEGRTVGGHFCFVSDDRLVAWQGAVDPELSRTHFLTPLLYWRNIMTACERGLAAVDFGGCVGRDTLWDFKRRCGALPAPRVQWQRRTSLGRCYQQIGDLLRRGGGGAR